MRMYHRESKRMICLGNPTTLGKLNQLWDLGKNGWRDIEKKANPCFEDNL